MKSGENLIGNDAINAATALLKTMEAKVPAIIEIQKLIMNSVKDSASKGEYSTTCKYYNNDEFIDDWIFAWLEDLDYTEINMTELDDEENPSVNTELTFTWKHELEDDEEENSDDEEAKDSQDEVPTVEVEALKEEQE